MYDFERYSTKEYTPTQILWANVFSDWPNKERDIDPKDMPQLYDVLSVLTERGREVIKMRCGLVCDPMTYCEIGDRIGVTPEKVRKISQNAFRKLRYKKWDEIMLLFATRSELNIQVAKQGRRIQMLEQQLNDASISFSRVIKALPAKVVEDNPDLICIILNPTLKTPLRDVNLSVRAFNCLAKAGIDTLNDLIQLTKKDLHKIKSMGNSSIREIEEMLSEYGLILSSDNK